MNEHEIKELWHRLHNVLLLMDEANIRILQADGNAQFLLVELHGHINRCHEGIRRLDEILCNDFPDWAKGDGTQQGGKE